MTQSEIGVFLDGAGAKFQTDGGKAVTLAGLLAMDRNHGPAAAVPKTFHTLPNHVLPMIRRATALAPLFALNPEEAYMTISWHDVVINFDPPADADDPLAMIKRHRGARAGDQPTEEQGNEALSAKEMQVAMRAYRVPQSIVGRAVYAVEVTYPGVDLGKDFRGSLFTAHPMYPEIVGQNPEIANLVSLLLTIGINRGPHFFQPHLEDPLSRGELIPAVALVVGLLDLGTVGMDTLHAFIEEGNREYRELKYNMAAHLPRLLNGQEQQDVMDRSRVATDMLIWRVRQAGFGLWQMMRFERIVYWQRQHQRFTRGHEAALRQQFVHFRRNVLGSLLHAAALRKEYRRLNEEQDERTAFANLVPALGYHIS